MNYFVWAIWGLCFIGSVNWVGKEGGPIAMGIVGVVFTFMFIGQALMTIFPLPFIGR